MILWLLELVSGLPADRLEEMALGLTVAGSLGVVVVVIVVGVALFNRLADPPKTGKRDA